MRAADQGEVEVAVTFGCDMKSGEIAIAGHSFPPLQGGRSGSAAGHIQLFQLFPIQFNPISTWTRLEKTRHSFRTPILRQLHYTRHHLPIMLHLVGLGLADEKDITVRGLEIVKKAERVYLEAYTAILLVDKSKLVSGRSLEIQSFASAID